MPALGSSPSRRNPNRKNTSKPPSSTKDDSSTSIQSTGQDRKNKVAANVQFPYRIIFLMESTSNNTRYIDIYKDAVNHSATVEDHNLNVMFIDHNEIVDSLNYKCAEKDDAYRVLHERTKTYLLNNGNISTSLMIQLVRQSVMIVLDTVRQKWITTAIKLDADGTWDASSHTQPATTCIILTNFFDLPFITDLIKAGVKVEAIVRLNCKKIAQLRDKFVSKASVAKQATVDENIQTFWRDFHSKLNTAKGSCAFKDVVMYTHESRYNSYYEPLNFDKIVTMSRAYTVREMNQVQNVLLDVETEHSNYMKSENPVYSLDVNQEHARFYELYSQQLNKIRPEVVNVAVVLDAIIKAINPEQLQTVDNVEEMFDVLKYNSDDVGCINYNVCIQYGNDCALAVKKYKLRFTDYFRTVVGVLKARWKNSLWGSLPLQSLNVEAAYDEMISGIKSRCESRNVAGDDVDVQLCVLALNRLQSNPDVFRGETIGFPGLRTRRLSYQPELIESVDCATMVQALDRASEHYRKTSYAYFEPEDVVLVVFYDFPDVAPARRSAFRYDTPQKPLYAKDYFAYFYGKRTPQRFYAIETAYKSCLTYREHTDEVRFPDDDCSLTVVNRKWRFEPDTVCMVYKSKRYEIVRHVTNDDDGGRRKIDAPQVDGKYDDHDRFSISSPGRAEFYVNKSSRGTIGFVGKTADDDVCTEIVSGSNYCVLRQTMADPYRTAVERCRRYGDGSVIVNMTDKNTITYWAGGKFDSTAAVAAAAAEQSKASRQSTTPSKTEEPDKDDPKMEGGSGVSEKQQSMKSAASKMKSSKSARSTRGGGTSTVDGMNKKASRMASRKDKPAVGAAVASPSPAEEEETDIVLTEYAYGGSVRTVEFEDGTRIATHVREVPGIPGWVHLVVSGYRYSHPAYGQVTEDQNGTFSVPGLVTRSADGGLRLSLGKDAGRIEVNSNAVEVYGVRRRDDDDPVIAAFGWKDSELLFDKQDSRENAPRRTRVAHDGTLYRTAPAAVVPASSSNPSAHAYFIVKRNMSGFRVLDSRQYAEFVDEIRERTHTIVSEIRDEIVALSVDGDTKKLSSTPDSDSDGYSWLTVFSGQRIMTKNITFSSMLLTSRTFRRANVDYGPVLDALTNVSDMVGGKDQDSGDDERQTTTAPAARLVVRINAVDYETVQTMYARGKRFAKSMLGSGDRMVTKLAWLKEHSTYALEARSRMRHNSFIPFFLYESYEPLRAYIVANHLSYPPLSII